MFKKLDSDSHGFTIMELLIVIVVVGILASIVFSSLQSVHRQARDAERRADIDSLQAKLEAYYYQNGRYPVSIESVELPGLDFESLIDPDGNLIISSNSESTNLPASGYSQARPEGSQYAYSAYTCQQPTAEPEVTDATETETTCQKYVLYAWLEDVDPLELPVYSRSNLSN